MPRRITIENDFSYLSYIADDLSLGRISNNYVNYVYNSYSTANDFENYISGAFDNYVRNSYIDNMHIMLTEKIAIDFLKKKGYCVYKKVMETK